MDYLLDTNILIYLGQNNALVKEKLTGLGRAYFFTSSITYFELFCSAISKEEKARLKRFLQGMVVLDLQRGAMDIALALREKRPSLKFKDLLILATAQVEGLTLLTADKDFKGLDSVQLLKI